MRVSGVSRYKKFEKLKGLERKLTIELSEQAITADVDKEASELAKTKELKGYRKGKVPVSVIKERFGQELRHRALSQLMNTHYFLALKEKALNAISMPAFELLPEEGKDAVLFTATFEVMPEVKLPSFKGLKVTTKKATVNDDTVNEMLEKIQRQHATWQKVERPAQLGDQANIDFVGKLKGEAFEGGTAQGSDLELGAGQFIEGFEEGIVGLSEGESKTLSLTFPKAYHAEDLAGQDVTFDVKVNHINERLLPEMNESFIKQLGIASGSVDDLKNELRSTMDREAKKGEQQQLKQAVLLALADKASIEIPNAMIDQEIDQMQKHMEDRILNSGGTKENMPDLPRQIFETEATQRVKLGLLVSEIIKSNELTVDEARVDETIASMAEQYQDAEEVVKWYSQNPEERKKLHSVVLEDQVVDLIAEQAKIKEETVSYEELLNPKK